MDRTTRGLEPGVEPSNVTPSYTFAILIQHSIDNLRLSVTRQSSHPELKESKQSSANPHLLLQSKSLVPPRYLLEDENDVDENEQPTFPTLPHSITACVVVDERKTAVALLNPGTAMAPVPGSELNLIVYLLATDPTKPFPKSRLTSVQEGSHSRVCSIQGC